MLSYRHGFHAGNQADVLKHLVLLAILRYYTEKDKPLTYLDTHAGAGQYALFEGYALKNREFDAGIGKLWAVHRSAVPELVSDYLSVVGCFNGGDALKIYPGSPLIALAALRDQDRLILCERHNREIAILKQNIPEQKNVVCVHEDGFLKVKSSLPPPSRRGVILHDPSYETLSDYSDVVKAVREGLSRFATGCYVVWYPILPRRQSRQLPQLLQNIAPSWCHITLSMSPRFDVQGLLGSGVFVINPPWQLPNQFKSLMPWLAACLHPDLDYSVDQHIP